MTIAGITLVTLAVLLLVAVIVGDLLRRRSTDQTTPTTPTTADADEATPDGFTDLQDLTDPDLFDAYLQVAAEMHRRAHQRAHEISELENTWRRSP